MGRATTLLVAGMLEQAEELAKSLCALGFDARACSADGLADRLGAFAADGVIALEPVDPATLAALRVVVSLCGPHPGAHGVIAAPAHPLQIASRVRALLRLSVLDETARLRADDVAAHGERQPQRGADPVEAAILYVGPPHPAFMRLQHAMAGAGAKTIAAFSTFNAFDYLHERAFDAVVLSAMPTPELAHTVCSAMRRNTRLYHTPTLLLSQGADSGQAEEAFARGASDIIDADAGADEMRARIVSLVQERQRRKACKGLLESCRLPGVLDEDTDLFTADFGRRHLQSLIGHAGHGGTDISAVSLLVQPPSGPGRHVGETHARSAMTQFASMLRHCVRSEDLAVRLENGRFYLALPDTDADQARIVAARVVAIAECTAYESADPTRPFRVEVQYDIAQAAPGDSAETLLARAFAELPMRPLELAV